MVEVSDVKGDTNPSVIERFAGFGGFIVGLGEQWQVVWSNQWEPSTKRQDASNIYVNHFGDGGHVCQDIEEVLRLADHEEINIPWPDLVVGGFPCQDYSVARVLSQASGLIGKKGVLWWSIYELLRIRRARFLLLENVDRLLKSPANQRGRDFAIMLASLARLGYRVHWRVINAADYGFPQRRRRVFIVGERTDVTIEDPTRYIREQGILARALPIADSPIEMVERRANEPFMLDNDLGVISERFGIGQKTSRFRNAGLMQNYQVHTFDVEPFFDGNAQILEDILQPPNEVDEKFFIPETQRPDWKKLKGAKREPRTHRKTGTEYFYAEGAIAFPDPLDKPSRPILTGEGGTSPSRFKHVIEAPDGRLRRLTPVEMEKLNGFEPDWTAGVTDGRRAFLMGNALVVGIVSKIGAVLKDEINDPVSARLSSPTAASIGVDPD